MSSSSVFVFLSFCGGGDPLTKDYTSSGCVPLILGSAFGMHSAGWTVPASKTLS